MTVPWSIPGAIVRTPASVRRRWTSSGGCTVATSMSTVSLGLGSSESRTHPPTNSASVLGPMASRAFMTAVTSGRCSQGGGAVILPITRSVRWGHGST